MLDHHQFRIIWLGSSGADPAVGQGEVVKIMKNNV